ncbi:hypothetical protein L596_002850 [Steinernema carpocapsae]|uniref:Uncharacterized protein n=1 Tax=Steinernema carpocapsae TaxID=34508 RepID=A0A4U8UQR7_STECR|nr:hypothetical protein L596_002850 [Steinernema carpocapsae]
MSSSQENPKEDLPGPSNAVFNLGIEVSFSTAFAFFCALYAFLSTPESPNVTGGNPGNQPIEVITLDDDPEDEGNGTPPAEIPLIDLTNDPDSDDEPEFICVVEPNVIVID